LAGLTQAEVARRMRVLGYYLPQPYISKLEYGEYPWGSRRGKHTAGSGPGRSAHRHNGEPTVHKRGRGAHSRAG